MADTVNNPVNNPMPTPTPTPAIPEPAPDWDSDPIPIPRPDDPELIAALESWADSHPNALVSDVQPNGYAAPDMLGPWE